MLYIGPVSLLAGLATAVPAAYNQPQSGPESLGSGRPFHTLEPCHSPKHDSHDYIHIEPTYDNNLYYSPHKSTGTH